MNFLKVVKIEEQKDEIMTPCTFRKVKKDKNCKLFNELLAKPTRTKHKHSL